MFVRAIAGNLAVGALAALIVSGACGPTIPKHNGERYSKPWKKAKTLKFDEDNEAVVNGTVSYPKRVRSRWYEVNLPGDGEMTVKMDVSPLGGRTDMNLGFEVLDDGWNVVTRRYPDPSGSGTAKPAAKKKKAKKANADGDDDDDDYGDDDDDDDDSVAEAELQWEQTLIELHKGRYWIHVYALGRLDVADFSMRVKYASGEAKRQSNFPKGVAYYDSLPVVPAFDDAPAVNCKSCDCRHDSRCKSDCGKCSRSHRPSHRAPVDCETCSCSSSSCKRKCSDKCSGPVPGATTARILRMVAAGAGTKITLNRGSAHGVAVGWKGTVTGGGGKAISNGGFTVKKVSSSTCEGVVGAAPDTVRAAGHATLSPP